jgi:hypothetical protein
MTPRRLLLVLVCLAVVPLGGCQVLWASITSPSDWIAGSSESISGSVRSISRSSGSGGGTPSSLAYRRDVRAWAADFAAAGRGTQDDFLRGIGRIAESHGVTHWEADPATLVAIGEGLGDAGWSAERMEGLRGDLADVPASQVELVLEGYRSAGS